MLNINIRLTIKKYTIFIISGYKIPINMIGEANYTLFNFQITITIHKTPKHEKAIYIIIWELKMNLKQNLKLNLKLI